VTVAIDQRRSHAIDRLFRAVHQNILLVQEERLKDGLTVLEIVGNNVNEVGGGHDFFDQFAGRG